MKHSKIVALILILIFSINVVASADAVWNFETGEITEIPTGTDTQKEPENNVQNAENPVDNLTSEHSSIFVWQPDGGWGEKAPENYGDIGNLKGFSDLDEFQWAKSAIEDMSVGTYEGLFSGTTEPNNQGLAQFSPSKPMTRAEFLTVVTRLLYYGQLKLSSIIQREVWYEGNYKVALANDLIFEAEYPYSHEFLNAPIPRQEMALILTRACEERKEYIGNVLSESIISDFNTVDEYYKPTVKIAYTKGLIAGKDSSGTFDPHATLTRAEGATVLYRLVDMTKRADVFGENSDGTITIYEGVTRYNRPAKAGDTFVKKDGTRIVLKLGSNGVLGEGQGVAPDVGLMGKVSKEGCENFYHSVPKDVAWVDSTGADLGNNDNSNYYVHKTTGEGHWSSEMRKLMQAYPTPTENGKRDGEKSTDPLQLYSYGLYGWYLYCDSDNIVEATSAPIVIYEGQERDNRNAKAGDMFVKKNGETIILRLGSHGILGEGQGVAADVGLLGQITEKGCEQFTYSPRDMGSWEDSSEPFEEFKIQCNLQNGMYLINKTTGEGYWSNELHRLEEFYPSPDREGYDGEITEDGGLHLYVWEYPGWGLNFYKGY